MKKTITILALSLSTLIAKAQFTDTTLTKRIDSLENKVAYVQYNLKKSHEVFNIGVGFIVAGSLTHLAILEPSLNKQTKKDILLTGAVIDLLGCGIIVYSHSYFKKASVYITPNTFIYKF